MTNFALCSRFTAKLLAGHYCRVMVSQNIPVGYELSLEPRWYSNFLGFELSYQTSLVMTFCDVVNKINNQSCKNMMDLGSNIVKTLGFMLFCNNFEIFYDSFNEWNLFGCVQLQWSSWGCKYLLLLNVICAWNFHLLVAFVVCCLCFVLGVIF
jgi:hypothetical protein